MSDCIQGYAATDSPSLGGFAEHLRARLAGEMTDDESRGHLDPHCWLCTEWRASYAPRGMFFVRNVGMDPSTGDYVPGASVDLSEDFWARDYQKAEAKAAFGAGGYQRYFNGFPAGRITLLAVAELLQALFNDIRNQPRWNFRPPRNLGELAAFVELEIRAVAALFLSSDYSAPFIGGQIQTILIPPPTDAVTLELVRRQAEAALRCPRPSSAMPGAADGCTARMTRKPNGAALAELRHTPRCCFCRASGCWQRHASRLAGRGGLLVRPG